VSVGASPRARDVGGRVDAPLTSTLTAGELVWLAALPCALALIVLILLLGPPLGDLLAASASAARFWPQVVSEGRVRPEDTEHARYVLALLGPVLIGGATLALARNRLRISHNLAAALVVASRAVLVGFVVAAVLYQRRFTYTPDYTWTELPFRTVYFTLPTLLAALVVAAVLAAVLHRRSLFERLARLGRERAATHVLALVVALAFVALWLLSAFNTDTTLATVHEDVWLNVPFWIDEPFAILNGQAPLVDFHAQYGQLWAYLTAGALTLFGASFTTYAASMLVGTAAALLAVFATFRRLTANSLVALALFLPFVATSFFMEEGPASNRYAPVNLFNEFPIRYAGPYVLLWLVVRRLDQGIQRSPIPLFLLAGLVAINNVEFGVPALGASLLALVMAEADRSLGRLARQCGHALVGIAGAVVAVVGLTLAVSGSLPDFEWLTTYARLFGVDGFGMLPMPRLGLHLVLYVTFVAALAVAVARAVAREHDAPLTGALAWAGVFGLGTGAYFAGRSHPHVLIDLFSAWSLAVALLVIVAARAIVRRPSRRPTVVELVVLAGFGLAVCSLAQTPMPWSQLERLREAPPAFPGAEALPASLRQETAMLVHKGEPVAVLIREGHRIAEDVGIRDVAPYANIEAMVTVEQWVEMALALRRSGGRRLLVQRGSLHSEQAGWLSQIGFVRQRELENVIAFKAPW
jgi:hypothetical protein